MINSTQRIIIIMASIATLAGCTLTDNTNTNTTTNITAANSSNSTNVTNAPVDPNVNAAIVGSWLMTLTQEGETAAINSTGVFNPDGTAMTNYPAHYTLKGNTLTVTADNGSTTMTATITESAGATATHMSGEWTNTWTGKSGTWQASRL